MSASRGGAVAFVLGLSACGQSADPEAVPAASDLEGTASGAASSGGGSVSGGADAGGSAPSGQPASAGGAPGGTGAGTSSPGSGGSASVQGDALGPYPTESSPLTRGGTMTFTNVGAPGWWPRRLDREPGDPACDYKDGADTWGGHCCLTQHASESESLAPFDEEMTLILKAIEIKQLAVYQPLSGAPDAAWRRVTAWDERGTSENIWFTREGEGSATFPGDLTRDDCVGYVMQQPLFDCGDGSDYYCPDDPGILHQGFTGSKLVVFFGSMDLDDDAVASCGGDGAGHPGPWVAFVASELVRDGGRKWNGLCNCYSKTGSVGDGCGEINVLEVVLDDNDYSNREFASTGLRSYQEGHVGGNVCGVGCERESFLPLDVDVVDACGGLAYEAGPEIVFGGDSDGCPVWRRPRGDRYFFILLDESRRMIQVGIVHPEALPPQVDGLLPEFTPALSRSVIDAMLDLRLPQ